MHQYTLEPVKVDITAKLSESIQSTDKIQSPFFGLAFDLWMNGFSPISPRRSFFVVSFYIQSYTK